jgi:hypothetical protein
MLETRCLKRNASPSPLSPRGRGVGGEGGSSAHRVPRASWPVRSSPTIVAQPADFPTRILGLGGPADSGSLDERLSARTPVLTRGRLPIPFSRDHCTGLDASATRPPRRAIHGPSPPRPGIDAGLAHPEYALPPALFTGLGFRGLSPRGRSKPRERGWTLWLRVPDPPAVNGGPKRQSPVNGAQGCGARRTRRRCCSVATKQAAKMAGRITRRITLVLE